MESLTAVQLARRHIFDAERELGVALVGAYMPGTRRLYKRGNDWVPCEIIEVYPFSDRVRIRGDSGKVSVINACRLHGSSQ